MTRTKLTKKWEHALGKAPTTEDSSATPDTSSSEDDGVMHKLTQNHYFSTVYIDSKQDIHQQLLDAMKQVILGLNHAYIRSFHCCETQLHPN